MPLIKIFGKSSVLPRLRWCCQTMDIMCYKLFINIWILINISNIKFFIIIFLTVLGFQDFLSTLAHKYGITYTCLFILYVNPTVWGVMSKTPIQKGFCLRLTSHLNQSEFGFCRIVGLLAHTAWVQLYKVKKRLQTPNQKDLNGVSCTLYLHAAYECISGH